MAFVTAGYATRALIPGEVCGDRCGCWVSRERTVLAVADGLGHGPEAARAATAALEIIDSHWKQECAAMFSLCDDRLRNTRGAALAIAIVEHSDGVVTVGSIGNIRTQLLHGLKMHRFPATRGIVGTPHQTVELRRAPLHTGNSLVMFSDGIDEYAPLRGYFEGAKPSAQQLAEVILAEHAHGKDDASVLIYHHVEIEQQKNGQINALTNDDGCEFSVTLRPEER